MSRFVTFARAAVRSSGPLLAAFAPRSTLAVSARFLPIRSLRLYSADAGEEHQDSNAERGQDRRRHNSGERTFERRERRQMDPEERARAQAERAKAIEQGHCVYVGNLPHGVSWQRLKDFMSEAGEVRNARIAKYPDNNPRGYGFVEFADAATAKHAVQTLNEQELDGHVITLRIQQIKTSRATAFVSNLPWALTSEDVTQIFGKLEGFNNARVLLDSEGRSRGLAVVSFDSAENMENCVATMAGKEIHGRELRVRETQSPRNNSNNNNDEGGRRGYGRGGNHDRDY